MNLRRAALAVLGVATTAAAYPIPPQTIWGVSENATLIVVARVKALETHMRTDDDWTDTTAILEVVEVLKGSATSTIEVPFAAHVLCPAPAKYLEGKPLIAFLRRNEKTSDYETVALSYGTRYADTDDDFSKLRSVVAAAVEAQTTSDPTAPRRWAIEAFRHRVTRWDGLFALAPESDEVHFYYARGTATSQVLTSQDLDQLEAGFIDEPSFDTLFVKSLWLFDGRRGARLTNLAIDIVETVLAASEYPEWIHDAVSLLSARLELRPYDAAIAEAQQRFAVHTRWKALKKRFHLEPHPRADLTLPLRTGTGGQTPP